MDVLEVTPPVDPHMYAQDTAREMESAPPMIKLSFVNRFGDTERADIKKEGKTEQCFLEVCNYPHTQCICVLFNSQCISVCV